MLELKATVNTMVDQLNSFAAEVTRVAREVGTDGKLGGQAVVPGVGGTWKDLTDSVNSMAGSLTAQVRNIADVTTAVARGDLSKKITVDARGEILELKGTINTMVDQLNAFAGEVTRVAREVGSEGILGGQAQVQGVSGTWKDLTDSVNSMAANLTNQVRNIAKVTTAVANGDLSKKVTVDVRGEMLELKDTINTMVEQLNAFAGEVTRVAREVGSEGILGGQAAVPGVAGTWKDLTDSVNTMAGNLTSQVRGIAKVVTSVANGDLQRKLVVDAKGEIAELSDTINGMIDTLAIFADQVTSVAREVGFEGKLGGQAEVPGAAGLWRDLTDSVNQLAAQLTSQIRAIGEVATAVTKGDLSRTIEVGAQGEVGQLTENVNEMIRNLRDTTRKNQEQDWLKTNLARFTGMLQGQKDIKTVAKLIMTELAPLVNAQVGIFYLNEPVDDIPLLRYTAGYAAPRRRGALQFAPGEGLVGQCIVEKDRILVGNAPADYLQVSSGTGHAQPLNVVVLPVLFEGDIKAVIELASFDSFSDNHLLFLDQLTQSVGIVLNTIAANMRTEELLKQSQSLTIELQSQQEELQQTNEELEEKARLLAEQNEEVEKRTREIEEARRALEQKAEQLALTSKYKSQFLANMSHELRTPLNSLLILSKQLSDNKEQNLSGKQVEMAQTIRRAGTDLLTLINDILDLSKIESGTTSVDITEQRISDICDDVERTFRGVAQERGLLFAIHVGDHVPDGIETDQTRLMQILKNLLSNAFKFTGHGSVELDVTRVMRTIDGVSAPFVAFSVRDTGIGIPADKHNVIFEAFQQADMSTARKYGGTGLGLAISREIAGLLGGEMSVESEPGAGSTFTFYHPIERTARAAGSLDPLPLPPRPRPVTKSVVPVPVMASPMPVLSGPGRGRPRRRAAGRPRRAHHRGRRDVRAHPARARTRPRLQGAHGELGRRGARAGAPVRPRRDHARHRAARRRRMVAARSAQAGPRDQSGSRARHLRRGAVAEGAGQRRVRAPQEAGERGRAHAGLRQPARVRRRLVAQRARHRGRRHAALRDGEPDPVGRGDGHRGLDRSAGARGTRRGAVRLRHRRSRPARHRGHRAHRADQGAPRPRARSGDRLHRPRAHRAGRRGDPPPVRVGDREGRDVARTADRGDLVLPQPGRGTASGGETARDTRYDERQLAGRSNDPDHGRRHAQHLRAAQRARGLQDERPERRVGRGGHRHPAVAPVGRRRADGHHDAGDGRIRNDPPDPRAR